ncbi:MAG TPA: MFS transporter [Burkholderiales bacterium]|nr:MFS transporter [Burkholderiales bacterium]
MSTGTIIASNVPARLDALPWSRWHWRVVIALGVTWLLDGLEVTVVGSLGAILQRPETLALSAADVGWAGSAYVGGAVAGALWFGRLADQLGRKRLFLVTLAVYVVATVLTAFSFDFPTFLFCRALTGFGIGGEYAAINSAVDELIPARVRGTVDLAINGTFWIGAALGAGLSLVLLDAAWFAPEIGWRVAFGLGAVLGIAILLVRRDLPESPRWLLTHGRVEEAEAVAARIEAAVAREHGTRAAPARETRIEIRPPISWKEILHVLAVRYRSRAVLGLALMAAQAFFYNALFFTYALVLARFYGVPDDRVGFYIFPFALGNFLGPVVLGRLFDSVGRRRMIALTYAASGIGLAATGWAFAQGWLDATTQAACWSAIFFIASAAASSAYLTVSEIFPVEMRAVAISIFYAAGTGIGGFAGPALFGVLIETGSRDALFGGYLVAAALMVGAAIVAAVLGVDAERKSLEEVAPPLSTARMKDEG